MKSPKPKRKVQMWTMIEIKSAYRKVFGETAWYYGYPAGEIRRELHRIARARKRKAR